MNKETDKLKELSACREAMEWARTQSDQETAWKNCERGEWMLWLLGRLSKGPRSKSRKLLVITACECARLSLKYILVGEDRPLKAIETAEKWANEDSSVSLQDVINAADAGAAADAYYAAAAAYYAGAAAYYAGAAAAGDAAAAAADAAAYAADAAADAYYADAAEVRAKIRKQCADIVRKHYSKPPKL